MQADIATRSKTAESRNIIDDAVREVGSTANKQDSVAIDQTGDVRKRYPVTRSRTWNEVDSNLEVGSCLSESSVSCFR